MNDEDTEAGKQILSESPLPGKLQRTIKDRDSKTEDKNDVIPADALAYILKCKSIFKCRICPRVVCLNEDSLKAHLKSKVIRYHVHCFLQLIPFVAHRRRTRCCSQYCKLVLSMIFLLLQSLVLLWELTSS